MKTFDIISTANQSLLRNKARTFLTVIAIFIGTTTLSLTNGIGSGIKSYLTKQTANLGNAYSLTVTAASKSSNPGSSADGLSKYVPGQSKLAASGQGPGGAAQIALTTSDVTKIKSIANVNSVTPNYSVTPDYIATATNPDAKYQFSLSQTVGSSTLDMAAGKTVSNNDATAEITVPSSYATSLGFSSASDAVDKTVNIAVSDATGTQTSFTAIIVGVQQKSLVGSSSAYANDALYSELYQTESNGLPSSTKDKYASVSATFSSSLSATQIDTIKSDLKNSGYTGKTVKDQVSTIFTIISAVTYVLSGFAGITLVAAAFGIVNTLYMSVSERTREIGLMKALGMGKRKIFALFSIEAILIGFWGSALGVGFASLLGAVVNSALSGGYLKDFPGLHLLSFPLRSSAIIVATIMLIAFLAGTLPARRASQKDPIEALRYE